MHSKVKCFVVLTNHLFAWHIKTLQNSLLTKEAGGLRLVGSAWQVGSYVFMRRPTWEWMSSTRPPCFDARASAINLQEKEEVTNVDELTHPGLQWTVWHLAERPDVCRRIQVSGDTATYITQHNDERYTHQKWHLKMNNIFSFFSSFRHGWYIRYSCA